MSNYCFCVECTYNDLRLCRMYPCVCVNPLPVPHVLAHSATKKQFDERFLHNKINLIEKPRLEPDKALQAEDPILGQKFAIEEMMKLSKQWD